MTPVPVAAPSVRRAADRPHSRRDAYGHARLPASTHAPAPERVDKIPYGRFRNVYLEGDRQMKLAKSDRGWMSGIAGDDVVTIGDPRLKAATQAVGDVYDVADLMARLVDRLRDLNGAGLAAPQIGASVKVVVVEVRKTDVFPDRPMSPLIQMINPVIVEQSGTANTGWEGCFSVPGLMGLVPRAQGPSPSSTFQRRAPMSRRYTPGQWQGA